MVADDVVVGSRHWVVIGVGGAVAAGLLVVAAVLFGLQGVEVASWLAGVASFVVAVAALVLALPRNPAAAPNSSEPPSDEPPQRRREPWTRKEKIAAGAVAAILLTAVPAAITLNPGLTSTAEKSNGGPAEASGKPPVEAPETSPNTAPSKPLTVLASGLIAVTSREDGTEMCVDDKFNLGQNGDVIQLWPCDHTGKTEGQRWTLYSDKTVRAREKCLDIVDNSSKENARLQLWSCNGVDGQQWIYTDDNQLKNPKSGLCLDVPEGEMKKATALEMYRCLYHSPQAAADTATPPTAGRPYWTQQWHFVEPTPQ